MERFTISKSEKQTIYEIYRACRICGAGGGYRMPIVQSIVDLETSDIELRQKIQDCLQLEVRADDRMPPLICELCVDKVTDFYDFLELSRQTNVKTRKCLGLPLQTARKGEPDPGDCILGVTEPLCDEPAPKRSTAGPKCSKKVKKETEAVNVKVEPTIPSPAHSRSSSVSSRSSRSRLPPTPRAQTKTDAATTTPVTQEKKKVKEKDKVKEKEKEPEKGKEVKELKGLVSRKELENLIKDNEKYEDSSLLVPRSLKRKEVEPPRPVIVPKRTRTTPKEPTKEPPKEPTKEPTPPPRPKPGPKSKKAALKEDPKIIPVPLKIPKSKSKLVVTPPKVEAPPPKTSFDCPVCAVQLKTNAALSNHQRTHTVSYTKLQNACNPCGKWFVTTEEAATHHRYHRAATFPYHCRRCFDDYRSLRDYDEHIANGKCFPYEQVPDVKCEKCWKTFVTRTLLAAHRCWGYEGRPGGKCSKCSKVLATVKSLKAHQKNCNYKKKLTGDLIADPDVLRRLKPMRVRIARCDDLLARRTGCDVSRVKPNYGLDKNYLYPYFRFKPVKREPRFSRPIRDEPERDRYTHWDSEDSDSDSVIRKVDSLTTLCLKKVFSKSMLGKVPRKKKKVRENAFDLNDFGSMSNDINDIISSLNDDLGNDCVRRNRKDSLIAIAINDIIGVPNYGSVSLGNENVARSSNDVHINDRDDKLNDRNESSNDNDNSKDLNDVQVENQGTDTVNSVSDISTELNLIESEDQNTRNDAATLNDTDTNDSKTRNDNFYSKKEEGESNDLEIRNFKSVDSQDDDLEANSDSVVQNNHLSTEDNHKEIKLDDSEMETDKLDSKDNYDNADSNHDIEMQNANNENANDESQNPNDNLDIKNNQEVINDLETQNENKEDDVNQVNSETAMKNDNFEINHLDTNNDCNNDLNNDLETQNENNEELNEVDSETEKNDNFRTNHLDIKNNGRNSDINNDLETSIKINEPVNLNSKTDTANLDMNNHENTELNRIETESKNSQICNEVLESLQNSIESELKDATANGIDHATNNYEETKKIKESPIKHSIDNLIGEDKNPDKYIDEVISSIEDIINKNSRNEEKDDIVNGDSQMDDQTLMDALDTQIGESKGKIENDKITLDDLLPKDNRSLELDDISDDDFNFDA